MLLSVFSSPCRIGLGPLAAGVLKGVMGAMLSMYHRTTRHSIAVLPRSVVCRPIRPAPVTMQVSKITWVDTSLLTRFSCTCRDNHAYSQLFLQVSAGHFCSYVQRLFVVKIPSLTHGLGTKFLQQTDLDHFDCTCLQIEICLRCGQNMPVQELGWCLLSQFAMIIMLALD